MTQKLSFLCTFRCVKPVNGFEASPRKIRGVPPIFLNDSETLD